MRRLSTFLGTLAAAALAGGPALANTEIITTYDARAAGMAHTGTATINNAAATFANPANLTDIPRLDLTVHFSPDFTGVKVPIAQATGIGETSSKLLITPLAFVGAGYKLHPGVAVGLAAQLTQVKGVLFTHTPLSLTNPLQAATLGQVNGKVAAAQLFWEVRAPIAVDVNKWLTVSAGYRMGFFHQAGAVKADAAPVDSLKTSVHGQNFAGAQAGISIKPNANVRLGLSYRSKMVLLGSGETTTADLTTGATSTQKINKGAPYVSPHMFTAGAAFKMLDHRLTIAGDFKYWMYKDGYAGMKEYRDAMSGHIGAEFMATPRVPVRAGYLIGLSATRKSQASPVDTTPGLQHGGTLGSGYHFNNVDLDAAVGIGGSNTKVSGSTTTLNGDYKLLAILVNLSATVHL